MEGLDAAKVGNGGAFIDTAGFDITIGQVLAHDDLANEKDGGLLKSGTGNLLLSGPNNYTGDTRVLAGELALGSASLGDDADLHISGGASLRLAHGISDTIRSLFLNGIRMKRGKYVPEGSTEAGIPTMFLTGSAGGLMVEADNFDDWAAGLPAGSRGREDDADKDGFNNLAEFLFGTPANSPDGALATISANSTGFTVRWLERDGGTYLVQEITDVSHWSPAPFTPVPSEQTGVPAGYNAMQVTVPLGTPTRMVRVRAEW